MDNDIKEACKIMQEGGLILYPTDTIWGIGCDATNELAVKRVYEIKKRIDSKALIVLVDSPAKIDFYTDHVPDIAWDLVEVADKPLTIVYPNARNLAHNLLAEDGSVGIRITKEWIAAGAIGKVKEVVLWTCRPLSGCNERPGGFKQWPPADPIPETLDWDKWQNTATPATFTKRVVPLNWRRFFK